MSLAKSSNDMAVGIGFFFSSKRLSLKSSNSIGDGFGLLLKGGICLSFLFLFLFENKEPKTANTIIKIKPSMQYEHSLQKVCNSHYFSGVSGFSFVTFAIESRIEVSARIFL